MIILIDFDDTIHDRRHIQSGYRMGQPEAGAITALRHFVMSGHSVIIFTGRDVAKPEVRKAVADWLDYWDVPYNGITNIKPGDYDLIIDNRAMHYNNNWPVIMYKVDNLNEKEYSDSAHN